MVALIDWLRDPEQEELRRTFVEWIIEDLIPSRVPGVHLPKVKDLQEVRSMIAELDWTKQWKQEGLEEGLEKGLKKGLEKGLEKSRGVLLRELERRFGLLPANVRQRVEAIGSIEELTELTFRAGAAASLADLKLSSRLPPRDHPRRQAQRRGPKE